MEGRRLRSGPPYAWGGREACVDAVEPYFLEKLAPSSDVKH
jgi:hypothetical protein